MSATRKRKALLAFTLLEMMAAILIFSILAVVIWSAYRANLSHFEAVPCTANLRALQVALAARMQDTTSWPQLPEGIDLGTYQEHDFWINELAPYGIMGKSWLCPTLKRTAREKRVSVNGPKIHYLPSLFDSAAATPYLWPKIPWVMEVGNNHGKGILMAFSDGSIRPYSTVLQEAAAKTGT
ncbi:MAG: prepilin-type N-terminal cleavage/methylation domain-containing protein, partial [Verrucomicrobiota bacterium]